MITIQSAMMIVLGIFLAGFVMFLLAPYYARRAARLATDALRRSMPLTEAEIRADKDRLRAEHAIAIHKLEQRVQEAALSSARQMVDINRRDAMISSLESQTASMRTAIEEHENARRVLEQTITDRLPRVEARLSEAKKQLFQRDQEITTLTQTAGKYSQALEEATQINAQQRDEFHRLNATITTRAARNREPIGADARFDSEVSLRAEIEALRAKTRDQSALISRLQGVLVKSGVNAEAVPGSASHPSIGAMGGAAGEEVARLRDSLSEAERALKAARSTAQAGQAGTSQIEQDLRSQKSLNQDLQAEIARLKASLRAYEADESGDRVVADSKIAMKARLSALQAQAEQYTATIQSMRAEIAATNEKLARQASQYMDEMRRLGAGTLPASGPGRRDAYEQPAAPSLAARIGAPRPVSPVSNTMPDLRTSTPPAPEVAAAVAPVASSEEQRVGANFLRALGGGMAAGAAMEVAAPAAAPEASGQLEARRRPGLLERLTGVDKPAASRG